MRNRGTLIFLAAAILFWASLILLMNRKPPDSLNQLLFLALWGGAIAFTIMPVAYVIDLRFATPLGARDNLRRVLRQGGLLGVLGILLMALQFIRLLTWPIAIILILVVILVELLFHLRGRQ